MILSKKQAEISSLWKIRLCFDCVKATNSIPDSFVAGQKLISWKDPSVNRCDIQSLVSFYSNINRTVGGYNVHFRKIARMWATSGNRIFCTKMVYHIYLNDFVRQETYLKQHSPLYWICCLYHHAYIFVQGYFMYQW